MTKARHKAPLVRSILATRRIGGRNMRGRLVKSAQQLNRRAVGPVSADTVVAFQRFVGGQSAPSSSHQLPPTYRTASTRTPSNSEGAVSKPVLALRAYLVERYAAGDLYATDVAELAWHLTQCELPFADLSLNPHEPSFAANASRKVQNVLGFKSIHEDFSTFQLRIFCPESRVRVWEDVECLSIAEALSQEFLSRPDLILQSSNSFDTEKKWRANRHLRAGELEGDVCVPCGVFVDGAAWAGKGAGTRESVVAMYVNIFDLGLKNTLSIYIYKVLAFEFFRILWLCVLLVGVSE